MEQKKKKAERKIENKEEKVASAPNGLRIGTRGRIFEGKVIRKFHKRVAIEFERMIYVKKYERYAKSKTKIHARLPEIMEDKIKIGDLIAIQECRPLSKIIHFIVIKKIKDAEELR
jgi:ribosomal protein S17